MTAIWLSIAPIAPKIFTNRAQSHPIIKAQAFLHRSKIIFAIILYHWPTDVI